MWELYGNTPPPIRTPWRGRAQSHHFAAAAACALCPRRPFPGMASCRMARPGLHLARTVSRPRRGGRRTLGEGRHAADPAGGMTWAGARLAYLNMLEPGMAPDVKSIVYVMIHTNRYRNT